MPLSQNTFNALLAEFQADPGAGMDAIALILLGLDNQEPPQTTQVCAPLAQTVRDCIPAMNQMMINVDGNGGKETLGVLLRELQLTLEKFYYHRMQKPYVSTVASNCP